jgi:hypothetical protein
MFSPPDVWEGADLSRAPQVPAVEGLRLSAVLAWQTDTQRRVEGLWLGEGGELAVAGAAGVSLFSLLEDERWIVTTDREEDAADGALRVPAGEATLSRHRAHVATRPGRLVPVSSWREAPLVRALGRRSLGQVGLAAQLRHAEPPWGLQLLGLLQALLVMGPAGPWVGAAVGGAVVAVGYGAWLRTVLRGRRAMSRLRALLSDHELAELDAQEHVRERWPVPLEDPALRELRTSQPAMHTLLRNAGFTCAGAVRVRQGAPDRSEPAERRARLRAGVCLEEAWVEPGGQILASPDAVEGEATLELTSLRVDGSVVVTRVGPGAAPGVRRDPGLLLQVLAGPPAGQHLQAHRDALAADRTVPLLTLHDALLARRRVEVRLRNHAARAEELRVIRRGSMGLVLSLLMLVSAVVQGLAPFAIVILHMTTYNSLCEWQRARSARVEPSAPAGTSLTGVI